MQGARAVPLLLGVPVVGYVNLAQSKAGHYFSLACALVGAVALFAVDCLDDGRKGRQGQAGPAAGGGHQDGCNAAGKSANGNNGGDMGDLASDASGGPGGRQSAGSVGGTVFGGGATNGAVAAGLWLQQQQGHGQVRGGTWTTLAACWSLRQDSFRCKRHHV